MTPEEQMLLLRTVAMLCNKVDGWSGTARKLDAIRNRIYESERALMEDAANRRAQSVQPVYGEYKDGVLSKA
jgi:hypothetical protein